MENPVQLKMSDHLPNTPAAILVALLWFSSFQDARLKQLVEEYQERWDMISEHFPDRSDVQCQQRWTKVVNPELVKGPWTKEVGWIEEKGNPVG